MAVHPISVTSPILPTVQDVPAPDPRRTVLIVEDYPAFRMILSAMVSSLGYSPLAAADGEAALAVAASTGVDVLLTDANLPHMHGIELARLFSNRYPDTELLLMTGYSRDDLVRRFTTIPPDLAILFKPFGVAALQAALAQCTRRSHFNEQPPRPPLRP